MGGPNAQYNQDGTLANSPTMNPRQNPYQANAADYSRSQSLPATVGAVQGTAQFNRQAQEGANNVGTDFNKFVPTLNTNFSASPKLDSYSQGLLSQVQQQQARGLAGQQASIARNIRGPQAQVLNAQAGFQSRLNANPATFQVASAQQGRQQQEQRLGNEALLAQQGAFNTGLSASNQAQTLKTGLQGLPVAAQQNLVSTLQSQQGK